jgi:hypothetical protein
MPPFGSFAMRPAALTARIDTSFRGAATASGGFVGLVARLFHDFPILPIR